MTTFTAEVSFIMYFLANETHAVSRGARQKNNRKPHRARWRRCLQTPPGIAMSGQFNSQAAQDS